MNDRSAEITELMEDVESFLSDAPETPLIPEVQLITVLETWLKVLGTADIGDDEPKVSMQFASHLIRSYPELKFRDLKAVDARFREKLLDFRDILQAEVDGEPAALNAWPPTPPTKRHLCLQRHPRLAAEHRRVGAQLGSQRRERHRRVRRVRRGPPLRAQPDGPARAPRSVGLEFGPDDEQTVIDAVVEQEGR